ncbi:MAG: hypothetical protein V2J10_11510 [Wenzhouxiangella sp.]|jgi:hypothetical protein|nr:hypothetical protein [Wenzhouxiangella sp.]
MSSDNALRRGFPTGRMTTYLSLSAASVIATDAAAEVVHIPAENLPVEIINNDQLFLRFSLRAPGGENIYDFEFVPQTAYGGTFMPLGGNQGSTQILVSEENRPTGAATSVGPGTTIEDSLADPNDLFWSNGYAIDPDDFDGPRHFLPVRFGPQDNRNYGFIEIEITPDGGLRILDAAWETLPEVPITTPSAVLDDAALSALAGGDEAVDSLRRSD